MMATRRTPADAEPLGPAIRILIKRVMADPALSAASRTVMTWLLLEGREEAPSASDMGHIVGLTERSVRRAYAELKEAGWLDPRRGWPETPRGETPERQAVLEGGRTELSATSDLPSFREHIAMLELIRDRALAKGRETTALSAQHKIGRAMGYDRPQKHRADRSVRAGALPRRQPGEGLGGGGDDVAREKIASPPPPRPSPTLLAQREGGRLELAKTGSELAEAGSELAKAGSNWQELAEIGCPENGQAVEKLIPINDLLEKPIFGAEKAWLAGRDDPSQRPFWLNGVSLTALESGQNCPPVSLQERAVS